MGLFVCAHKGFIRRRLLPRRHEFLCRYTGVILVVDDPSISNPLEQLTDRVESDVSEKGLDLFCGEWMAAL